MLRLLLPKEDQLANKAKCLLTFSTSLLYVLWYLLKKKRNIIIACVLLA